MSKCNVPGKTNSSVDNPGKAPSSFCAHDPCEQGGSGARVREVITQETTQARGDRKPKGVPARPELSVK